jgi:ATP-binding cassette subfamily B protein/subfamily B ATP-binding cassette protein MsbA
VFLVYLGSLQAQVKIFASLYTTLQGLRPSVERAVEALEASPELPEKSGAPALLPVRKTIEFENVTAGYEPGRAVLRNISLHVEHGQTIAIVGHTGAGKTTLVNLIPRFMDPWEGRVLIDGHDLREVSLKSVREQVALVLQDSFLFPLSVADNIAYARPGAARSEIEAAAQAANAHDFIASLPQGYETVIGERGATLSGGERQRLSIARAILKDAPILILDEPTSALDSETERDILQALQRLMKGRTTFVIAHRLSTVRRANLLVVLERGQIIETGSHNELLASGGQYARMQQLQNATELVSAS